MRSSPPHRPPLRLVVLAPRPPRPRVRPWLLAAALLVPLLLVVAGSRLWPMWRTVREVRRIPVAMDTLRAAAPAGAPSGLRSAHTFLLIGTDEPTPEVAGAWPAGRSDAILLAHLTADRRALQVVSIPRDAWVEIPGHGDAKLNAAYAWGGAALLVRSVQQLTGVHVDHVAAVDLPGLASLVDSLGGVTVTVADSTAAGGSVFAAGENTLDGVAAAHYVRQRHGLPHGDLDRVQRHQELLRAALQRFAAGPGGTALLHDPEQLAPWLRCVRVDESLSAAELARWWVEAHAAGAPRLQFLTAPIRGFGTREGQSVVWLDPEPCRRLWCGLASDSLDTGAAEFAAWNLPEAPR